MAILGNFVNRVIVLTSKYFEGVVPEPSAKTFKTPAAKTAFAEIAQHIQDVEESLENFRFRDAQAAFINVARVGNKYLTDEEPWKKWKETPDAVKDILFNCLQIIHKLGVLSQPFLPDTAGKIADLLKLSTEDFTWDSLREEVAVYPGHQAFQGKPDVLFEKVEDEVVEAQVAKLGNKDENDTSHLALLKRKKYNLTTFRKWISG